ncbi:MAG: class II fumarate hydratase [Dehalococcoidia bacterium]|nr:class II fumarate hydratase [Dehalococcoidia bacterium]
MTTNKPNTRVEKDSMGPMDVPAEAYYGASTQRAALNFPISTERFSRRFIRALALIKLTAAQVNSDMGLLDKKIADAIIRASQEMADGKFDKEFVVDIYQTGSGTSTNMNANEVIANRAAEHLGGQRGSRAVHPNDHVNMGQSSNDVIPTAIQLAAAMAIKEDLSPAMDELRKALQAKSQEFWPIIKTGRTHLQDATPIRLGQEFLGYAGQAERAVRRLKHAQEELSEVPLGGTAVGTGINTHPQFPQKVCARLSEVTGISVRETDNHFQAQNSLDALVEASGVLRTISVSLYKIANDIRWLGTGPRAGIGEIVIPEVQPGSSIMPGKVNPVIPESVLQAVAQVQGNDLAVLQAGHGGVFELNMMMPVAAHNLLGSITLLASVTRNFTRQCVVGLKATDQGPKMLEAGLMLTTALVPAIGYDAAAAIAKKAHATGKTIREVAKTDTKLTDKELNEILDPSKMVQPGLGGGPAGG